MGLKILGKMILKGQLKAFTSSGTTTTTTTAAPTTTTTTTAAPTTTTTTTTTAAPTPLLTFFDTNNATNLSYSGLGTTSNRLVGYVGGLGNDTSHNLRFTVNATGTLYYKITVSSEESYDYGYIQRTRSGSTVSIDGGSGSFVAESTSSVLVDDIITIYYYTDGSVTTGLDRITFDYLYIVSTTTTTTTTAAPTTTTTTTTTTTAAPTTTTTTTTTAAPTTTTTTTTTAAPTTTTTTTTTAAPTTMILSVNSTPRALVGGGVTYDPTFINADYRQYFTSVNNNLNNCILNGYLPLQNNLNSSYSYTYYNESLPTFIFDFRIPTVITKYRMWNGFMANIGVYLKYTDLGNQTPQAWSLEGSNDEINWTTVDTRTSQDMLPYASTNDPATSSYSEFSISSPAAYKSYRLILSTRGRTGFYCGKSGCSYDTQLGEVQLWGYESPTTPCALHGYNTLLPTAKYYTSAGVVTNTDPFSSAFNMGNILSITYPIASWNAAKNSLDAFFVTAGSTKEGYLGFDYPITLTSYKLWSSNVFGAIPTYSFRVYGANTFGTWTLLDTRTLATVGSDATFTIASPALYSYYRISIFGSSATASQKSGGGFYGLIRDIQLQGYLT